MGAMSDLHLDICGHVADAEYLAHLYVWTWDLPALGWPCRVLTIRTDDGPRAVRLTPEYELLRDDRPVAEARKLDGAIVALGDRVEVVGSGFLCSIAETRELFGVPAASSSTGVRHG